MVVSTIKQLKFSRFSKIVGEDEVSNLFNKTVLVLGCGGVGGYVVEGLVRSGIGRVIIVDYDVVDVTNINRQIIALDSTIGRRKVDVLEDRIKDINGDCEVVKIDKRITKDNIEELFSYDIDYFIDACDTVSVKMSVIDWCLLKGVKFISSMGTGNRIDPSKLEIMDIRKTFNDPLARILRKYVKDKRIRNKIMVLSSLEDPVKTHDRTPGSSVFVPASSGLLIASYVIKDLLKK